MSTPTSTSWRPFAALTAGLALTAALAACGTDNAEDTATDPAASSSAPTPTQGTSTPPETDATTDSGSGAQATVPATGSAGVTEATLLSATEGGGSASTLAFALDTDLAVADFAGQFDGSLADMVSAAAADQQTPGATTYGATAAVGCEAPEAVAVEAGEAGFEVIPQLPKNTVQCLAPMTFVVLFAVPDA